MFLKGVLEKPKGSRRNLATLCAALHGARFEGGFAMGFLVHVVRWCNFVVCDVGAGAV